MSDLRSIKLRKKSESALMRIIAFLLKPFNKTYMSSFWTTIGRTVYVPTRYDSDVDWGEDRWLLRHMLILRHEQVHIGQRDKFGFLLFAMIYLGPSPFLAIAALCMLPFSLLGAAYVGAAAIITVPLSIGLAYGRWRMERAAYMIQIRESKNPLSDSNQVASTLWNNYLYTWPKKRMARWFYRQVLVLYRA